MPIVCSAFFLPEVRALEQNIEADCRRSALAQVLDDVCMDGTVPLVVVAQFRKRVLVDIDNHDVGLEAVAHRDLAILFQLFECLAGLYLEELVVEDVLHVLRRRLRDVDVGVLRISEEENEKDKYTCNRRTDENLLNLFQYFFIHVIKYNKRIK